MRRPAIPQAEPSTDQVVGSRSLRVIRLMTILGAGALGISVVGFLVGIAAPVVPRRAAERATARPAEATARVPAYAQMDVSSFGPNQSWNSDFVRLKQSGPSLLDPVVRTPAMTDAALRDRLRTRAFDGAPPVIPHAIEQQTAASCLVCHGNGMKLGTRIATRVSHPHYSSCTQCHVESGGGPPIKLSEEAGEIASLNEFAGLLRSGRGTRAMLGAPPTIPHTLHLRGDCMSCHGLLARPGLRTTHPWLQNCVQCHAAQAEHESHPVDSGANPTAPGDSLPTD